MDFMDNEVDLFNDLNNDSSEIHKKNLNKTNDYIQKLNLASSKRKILKSSAGISGAMDILININHGTAPISYVFKNLFKGNNMCLQRDTRTSLEKAHCNIYPRPELLKIAIENDGRLKMLIFQLLMLLWIL